MRVAHVTSGLDRRAAGVGAVVEALSLEQLSLGHDVRVFGLESSDWSRVDRFRWEGAPVEALKVISWARSFGLSPGLRTALSRFEPDIVHLHGLWMYPSVAVLQWHLRTGNPYIYSPHGMLSPVALSYSKNKKRIARILFQDKVIKRAAALVASAAAEADDIRLFGLNDRVSIVPHGIHVSPVPPTFDVQNKSLLTLGRIHPVKNLHTLIEAWALLESKHTAWSLHIVGPDECGHRSELQDLVAKLKLQRVTFRAAVDGNQRNVSMASANLFVLPSRSENFALTVAESLMMETPVIATRGAPWSGLVDQKCGWWIEHGVDPLVAALDAAMSLPEDKRNAMGQRGRAWMLRDYSWESVANRMLSVYDDAIAQRSVESTL